jgi:hypothetical protein
MSRCYICDWSFSNKKSLFHPEVEDYKYNSLSEDEKGRPICRVCLGEVDKMLPKEDTEISKYMLDHDIRQLEWYNNPEEDSLSESVYDPMSGQFSGGRKQVVRYD